MPSRTNSTDQGMTCRAERRTALQLAAGGSGWGGMAHKRKMATMTMQEWKDQAYQERIDLIAERAAWAGNTIGFSTRRIVQADPDMDAVFYINNNPYSDDAERRGKENEAIKMQLEAQDIRLLATVSYPKEGEDAGYTTCMMFDTDAYGIEETEAEVKEVVRAVCQSGVNVP